MLVELREEVDRQRSRRRALKYRMLRLEFRMERMVLQMEATRCRCRCQCGEGDNQEEVVDTEVGLIDVVPVDEDGYFDPQETFGVGTGREVSGGQGEPHLRRSRRIRGERPLS